MIQEKITRMKRKETMDSVYNTMPDVFRYLRRRDGACVYFRRLADADTDRPYVEQLTGEAFWTAVACTAETYLKNGYRGKNIGLFGVGSYSWLVCFCAVLQMGGTAVLLDPRMSGEELAAKIRHADVSVLLYDDALIQTVNAVSAGIGSERITACSVTASDQAPPSAFDADAVPDSVTADSIACIVYTSGTTAVPETAEVPEAAKPGGLHFGKAVMLSHRAVAAGICHKGAGIPFSSQLAVMPFHHISGWASVLNTLYLGAVVCLAEDMKYLFRYLEYLKPDYVLCVPSVLKTILRRLRGAGMYGSGNGWNLRWIGCGGAAFPAHVMEALHRQGIRVYQYYGATETGSIGLISEMTAEHADALGNMRSCSGPEIRIRDGELYMRSDAMMTGYYNDPEATEAVLRDGWYATGDLCRTDEAGYLYLTGRKSNRIILSNGENVCPEEIEAALCRRCPDIAEIVVFAENEWLAAAVYPTETHRNQTSGQAAQRAAPEAALEAALDAYNAEVPPYRQIRRLILRDAPFSRNATGKIIRDRM